MDIFWEELAAGFPDTRQFARVVIRLVAAGLLGGLIGIQRERAGKPAGLRTHMLVCLGTTVLVLAGTGAAMDADAVSRIVQGVATGVGFIGAGAILKRNQAQEIQGLTTAAGVWMTAAIGVAVGLGSLGLALLGTLLTLVILLLADPLEDLAVKRRVDRRVLQSPGGRPGPAAGTSAPRAGSDGGSR
jgi:putative Mg2+ transporter-C (MgtC) family protein